MTAQAGGTLDPKATLRRELRAQRAHIPRDERERAAADVARVLQRCPAFRRARRIGIYLAHGSELDTGPLIALCRSLRKQLCVPLTGRDGRMHFVRYDACTPLRPGAFGISRPARATRVALATLDLILLPLVGFDDRGRRLGAGGGYYDRLLAARPRARLIGCAFDSQRVAQLPADAWDVPLDGVLTPSGLRRTGHWK